MLILMYFFASELYIMEIHDRIKAIREDRRLSQSEVADKLGISYQGYWKIEHGKTELTLSRLQQIAAALSVSQAELLGFDQSLENAEYGEKLMFYQKRVTELEEVISNSEASERKYADFVGVLFHRLDWVMLVVAFDHKIITDKELGNYLYRDEYEGKKTANIKLERVDNFPNYESYTSQLMTQKQIFDTLPLLNEKYSHDYQTLIKLYQSELIPNDGLKKALDNRLEAGYWGVQATS